MEINVDFCRLVLMLSFITKIGECLKCVQCSSLVSRQCERGYVPATDCKQESSYCVKYIGNLQSGTVLFRDCSAQRMADVCTMKFMGRGNHTKVRVCYETCDSDGCNDGPFQSAATHTHRNGPQYYHVTFTYFVLHTVFAFLGFSR